MENAQSNPLCPLTVLLFFMFQTIQSVDMWSAPNGFQWASKAGYGKLGVFWSPTRRSGYWRNERQEIFQRQEICIQSCAIALKTMDYLLQIEFDINNLPKLKIFIKTIRSIFFEVSLRRAFFKIATEINTEPRCFLHTFVATLEERFDICKIFLRPDFFNENL